MVIRIYSKEYVILDYDHSVPCVVATSLRFMMLEEFKSQLDFGYNFMREKNKETESMVWIADTTLASVFDEDDVKWIVEDWTHHIIATRIRHLAFVIPEGLFTQMALDNCGNKLKGSRGKEQMNITFFKDVKSAKKWFRDPLRILK
jgi:hypothetical protein